MKEKAKKISGKVFNILSLILLIVAVGMLIFVATSKIMNKAPQIFGYSFHFVVSDSMEDEINIGDLVIGKKTDINDIEVGDDIIFVSTDPSLDGKTIVHRVRSIDDSGEVRKIYTYGIKYNKDDNTAYPVTAIIGRAAAVSSFWGKVFNPVGMIFILLIIGMAFVFYFGLKALIKSHRELKSENMAEAIVKAKAKFDAADNIAAEQDDEIKAKEKQDKETD